MVEFAFSRYDAENNGVLTLEELTGAGENRCGASSAGASEPAARFATRGEYYQTADSKQPPAIRPSEKIIPRGRVRHGGKLNSARAPDRLHHRPTRLSASGRRSR